MRISDWSSDVCSSDLPRSPQLNIRLSPDEQARIKRAAGRSGKQVGQWAQAALLAAAQASEPTATSLDLIEARLACIGRVLQTLVSGRVVRRVPPGERAPGGDPSAGLRAPPVAPSSR